MPEQSAAHPYQFSISASGGGVFHGEGTWSSNGHGEKKRREVTGRWRCLIILLSQSRYSRRAN
jgi:hypothetical protein